ncbi:MAG: Phosphate-selective porin [Bacteroidota bacterium]|nr:Phosphate-selective porin [Bacteroidota bacterium]
MKKITTLLLLSIFAFQMKSVAQQTTFDSTVVTKKADSTLISKKPETKKQPILSFKLGKGFTVTDADSTASLNIGLYVQARLDVSKVFDKSLKPQTTAQIRRLRLSFKGFAFTPKLEYNIQLGLSPADIKAGIVYDAYVRYSPVKQFAIQFGQGKLPGNREQITSDANGQYIERSTTDALFKLERDFALQLQGNIGKKFIFRPTASISTGEGKNFITASWQHFDYTFRAEILPFGEFANKGEYSYSDLAREQKPKLAIAGAYDFNNKAAFTKGQIGGDAVNDTFRRNIQTAFADLIFKYNGLCFSGEYAKRFVKDPTAKAKYTTGQSFWVSAAYDFKKNYEPAFRFTRSFAGKKGNIGTSNEYTIALAKYFYGHALKLQTDYTLIDDKTTKKKTGVWKFQLQVAI